MVVLRSAAGTDGGMTAQERRRNVLIINCLIAFSSNVAAQARRVKGAQFGTEA